MDNSGRRLRENRDGKVGFISSCFENYINLCMVAHVSAPAKGERLKSTVILSLNRFVKEG